MWLKLQEYCKKCCESKCCEQYYKKPVKLRKNVEGSTHGVTTDRRHIPVVYHIPVVEQNDFSLPVNTCNKEWQRIIFSHEKKFNFDGYNYYFHDLCDGVGGNFILWDM